MGERCHVLPALLQSCWSKRIFAKPYVVIDMNQSIYKYPDGGWSVEHTSYGPMSLEDAIKVGTTLNDGVAPKVYDQENWYEQEYTKKYQT